MVYEKKKKEEDEEEQFFPLTYIKLRIYIF